jgi:hypothetical protein
MSEPEAVVYRLKIEREGLVRSSGEYHRARLNLQSTMKPGAAQDKAIANLNADFPMGDCCIELNSVNAAIMKATAALHRFQTSNLKQRERFDSRRINTRAMASLAEPKR